MSWIKTAIVAGALAAMSAVSRGATLLAPDWSGKVTEISGLDKNHVQFPIAEEAMVRRPGSVTDNTLDVEGLYIHDLTNQKALSIGASATASGVYDAYSNILVHNALIQNINRDANGLIGGQGVHIDFIRIGGGDKQNHPTNVTLDHVRINNGGALPVLVTDGIYHDLIFKDVSITNTTLGGIQIKADKVGHVDHIFIENSPGLRVTLLGRPGSIGDVTIINSKGAVVGDMNPTGLGISGAKIITEGVLPDPTPSTTTTGVGSGRSVGLPSPSTTPVPEPASLSMVAVGGLLLARRPRRA